MNNKGIKPDTPENRDTILAWAAMGLTVEYLEISGGWHISQINRPGGVSTFKKNGLASPNNGPGFATNCLYRIRRDA